MLQIDRFIGRVFGAPSIQLSRGYLIFNTEATQDRLSQQIGENKNLSEYLGYGFALGLSQKTQNYLIGGAPRSDALKGEVHLFDGNDAINVPKVGAPIKDPSGRVGTYFGSSVASADVNGDG